MKDLEKKNQQRFDAGRDMPKALRPFASEVRISWKQGVMGEFGSRWDIGAHVNAARSDPTKYGQKAEEQLFVHFRNQFQSLGDAARVAGQFDRETAVKLAEREMLGGGHVDWQHMVIISAIPSAAARERVVERTFQLALTPDELAGELAASADIPCAVSFHAPVRKGLTAAGRSARDAMCPALTELVMEIESLQTVAASSLLIAMWQIGQRVAGVNVEEKVYGSNAIGQMAKYMGCPMRHLYDLAGYAKVFDRATVERLAARKCQDGSRLTWEHLALVATEKIQSRREWLIDTVIDDNLSPRQLKRLIRVPQTSSLPPHLQAEKPKPPKSAFDGIWRIHETFRALNKRAKRWTGLADSITDDLKRAQIDDGLLHQLTMTNQELTKFMQWSSTLSEKLASGIERSESVLAARAAAENETQGAPVDGSGD